MAQKHFKCKTVVNSRSALIFSSPQRSSPESLAASFPPISPIVSPILTAPSYPPQLYEECSYFGGTRNNASPVTCQESGSQTVQGKA